MAYVIIGATGNTGRVAAESLLAAGRPVRVVVRNQAAAASWKAKGAEVARATLEDPAALEAAFDGAQGVYFLIPPDAQTQDDVGRARRLGDNVARALVATNVPHVVLLSSVGAQHASGTGPIAALHDVEAALGRLPGLARTFLRPAYFLENWGSVLGLAKAQGVLPTFLPPELRFPQIATADIGRAAARALGEPPARGETRVVELAGAVDASASDVAAVVSAVLGRPVAAVPQPLDAVVPTFTGFGLSTHMAEKYREMYQAIAEGRVAFEGAPVRGQLGPREALAPLLA